MLREKTGIGAGLLFCTVFSSIFGFGVMEAPYVSARYGGPNGYWGVIFAFILAIPVILVTVTMGSKFPGKSIIDYLPLVFGKVLGKIIGLLFLIIVLIFATWGTQTITALFSEFFLLRTPLWAITFMVLGTIGFIAHKGVEGITRVTAFIFPVVFVFIIMALAMSFQGFEYGRVKPVFLVDGLKIPYCSIQMFYCFFPLSTILIIYPYLTEKKKGLKTVVIAALFAIIPILIMVFSAIGIYGYKGVLRYAWPMLQMTTQARLPYVFQTFGLFFAITWYSQIALALSGLYYASAQGFSELLGALNYKWLVLILLPISYVIILLIPGMIEVRTIVPYLRIVGFMIIFTVPLITWLISLIRKTGEVKHAS